MSVINSSGVITRSLNFVKKSGDTMVGSLIMNNNIAVRGKETGGTVRNLIKMNASEEVELGNATRIVITPNILRLSTNNTGFQGVDSVGNARNLTKVNATDDVEIASSANPILVMNTMNLHVNNLGIQGREVGGTLRLLLRMNSSDQIQHGNTLNTNIFPNTLRISTNNKALQGTQTDAAVVNMANIDTSNNLTLGQNTLSGFINFANNVGSMRFVPTGTTSFMQYSLDNLTFSKLNIANLTDVNFNLTGAVKINTNNVPIQGKETGATFRNLIKMNASDQVEIGAAANDLVLTSPLKLPQARVTHSIAQSIPDSAVTTLVFDTERWDNDVIHDNVTNNSRLTAKTAGLYTITANISFASNATGRRLVRFLLNSTTVIGQIQSSVVGANDEIIIITTAYQLNANDFIEVQVFQSSGGSLNVTKINNVSPEFMMSKISDF